MHGLPIDGPSADGWGVPPIQYNFVKMLKLRDMELDRQTGISVCS